MAVNLHKGENMGYASFWKRTAAYLVDGIIYGICSGIVSWTIAMVMGAAVVASGDITPAKVFMGWCVSFTVAIACYIAYYVWPESSAWQATIGKKLFGLKVTDANGQRISFWRSLGRNFGMILSWLLLCIGCLMCLWTEKRQCLHDKLADCLVVDTTPDENKVAAAVVIVLYILFLLGFLGLAAAIAIPQYHKSYNRAYGEVMERVHFGEALFILQEANDARTAAEESSKAPVTRWDQMDYFFACTVQSNPGICESEDFTYELKKNTISATRRSEENNYTLSLDNKGNRSCVSYKYSGADPCKQLLL